VVLELVYLLAANLFLRLGGVQKALAGADEIGVHFGRAWSFWPGRVHLEDLRIVFQDKNLQFSILIPHASVTVQLRALLHRTFYATRVSGSGLVFRLRNRVELGKADRPVVRAFPPVNDFDDPALYVSGPPKPPHDPAHFNPWTVHIENVDVEVHELWVQMLRYQGTGRAKGAFRLVPATRLWVGPASLSFANGTVEAGPYDVVTNLEGSVACTVHDLNVNQLKLSDVLRFTSAKVSLWALLPRLQALGFVSPGLAPLAIEDGSGMLDVDVALDRGVFVPGSRGIYRTDHIGMTVGRTRFRLDGELGLMAAAPAGTNSGQFELSVPAALLSFAGAQYDPIQLREVDALVSTSTVDATRRWSFAGARAKGTLTFRDLRAIRDLPIPHARSLGIEGGRGEALATAGLSPRKDFEADVEARIEDAQGAWGPLHWRGSAALGATVRGRGLRRAHIDGRVAAHHLATCNDQGQCSMTPSADVSGAISISPDRPLVGRLGVEADDFALDVGKVAVGATSLAGKGELSPTGLSATIGLTNLSVGVPGHPPSIRSRTAELIGRFPASHAAPPVTVLLGKLAGTSFNWGTFTLQSEETRLESTWDGQRLAAQGATGTLRMEADGGAPRGWNADVNGASIRMNLRKADDKLHGPLHLELGRLVGRIGQTGIEGDLAADFSLGGSDPSHRTTDFGGVVRLRNVALQAQRGEVHDWWANLGIQVGHVNARENLDVTGRMQADFRDALPVLQVLSSQDRIPHWVPRLFPFRPVHLDLAVERYCHRTDVQVLAARGGQLDARARLLVGPGKVLGALYLRHHVLHFASVGFNFVQESRHTSPFVATAWFDQQLLPLDELVRQRRATPCID
jgi:hypothetical protein